MSVPALRALGALRVPRVTPAVRISLGLSALVVSLLLAIDLFVGLIPDQRAMLHQMRQQTSENIALHIAPALTGTAELALGRPLGDAMLRDPTIRSIAVRRVDGGVVASAGDHERHWVATVDGKSTVDHVSVPLYLDHARWGNVEVSFVPSTRQGWRGMLKGPLISMLAIVGIGAFFLFSMYMRRVLQYLDPSAVIPERVRLAFDAFSEGVMVVDVKGKVMLANARLREWTWREGEVLHGKPAQDLFGQSAALGVDAKNFPWMRAMAAGAPLKDEYIEFTQDGGEPIKAMVGCAPVLDGRRTVRGCIVTFDDITELERVNRQLTLSVEELVASKAQIERQNEELRRLATRDPLTGCLNRRAFFEKLESLFVRAQSETQPLCCIITDIDHFKSFNDRYGHAIGDQVLQVFSHSLGSGLRDDDLLCRYGGEEFCIVLPDVSIAEALVVADRLRSQVESRAGKGIRSTPGIRITASFGVAVLEASIADPVELIDRADQALYQSKRNGRNRVTQWTPEAASLEAESNAAGSPSAIDTVAFAQAIAAEPVQ